MSALKVFAKLLGIPPQQAEEALHSAPTARALLSRRGLLISGLVATGAVLVGGPLPLHVYSFGDCEWVVAHHLADAYDVRREHFGDCLSYDEDPFEELKDHWRMGIWSDAEGRVSEYGDGSIVIRTMADWCRTQGRGYLACEA